MNKIYRFVLLSSALALMGLNGCDSDAGAEKPDSQNPCTDACTPDEMKCDGDAVYICEKSEDTGDACYTWTLKEECEKGKHCDGKIFECVAVDECTEFCDEDSTIRCTIKGLEECIPDKKGCASWSVIDSCEGGSCDPQTLKCVKSCDNQCFDGEKKCDGNGIATCIKDADRCLNWGEPVVCGENKTCDPETFECVDGCDSTCSEKDNKETFATSQKVCTDVNGKGCLQWVETKCKKGEKFDADQDKCVSVCGNDCEAFSIVFLPDTQYYVRNLIEDPSEPGKIIKNEKKDTYDIFSEQLKWIRDNAKKKNIKAVIHLGDITDTNANLAWEFVNRLYKDYIDDLGLPYTVAPGNHDFMQCDYAASKIDNKEGNTMSVADCKGKNGSSYNRVTGFYDSNYGNFNISRFKGKDKNKYKWLNEYKYDTNSYITFKAANIDFLVIALEYAPRQSAIDWANDVILNHPSHKVIIETHGYIRPSPNSHCTAKPGTNEFGQFTNAYLALSNDVLKGFNNDAYGGEYIFKNLVAKHNNVIMMVNGHNSGSCFRLNKGDNGNVVAEMVVDYQTEDGIGGECGVNVHAHSGGGTGWLRILTFDPQNYTITSSTTSVLSAKTFKDGKKWFYCKELYPQDPAKKPGYIIDMDSDAHRYTNHHAFVANFDFVTPVDYIKP